MGDVNKCVPTKAPGLCVAVLPKDEKQPEDAIRCEEKTTPSGTVKFCLMPDPDAPWYVPTSLVSGVAKLFVDDDDKKVAPDARTKVRGASDEPPVLPSVGSNVQSDVLVDAPVLPLSASETQNNLKVPVRVVDGKRIVSKKDLLVVLDSAFPGLSQLNGQLIVPLILGTATELVREKLDEDPTSNVVMISKAELDKRIKVIGGAVEYMQDRKPVIVGEKPAPKPAEAAPAGENAEAQDAGVSEPVKDKPKSKAPAATARPKTAGKAKSKSKLKPLL